MLSHCKSNVNQVHYTWLLLGRNFRCVRSNISKEEELRDLVKSEGLHSLWVGFSREEAGVLNSFG